MSGFERIGYTLQTELKELLSRGTRSVITEVRVNKWGAFIRLETELTSNQGTGGKLVTVWQITKDGNYRLTTGWVKIYKT